MSKLEELIARLCPDGVEYKELGDIGTLTRGKRFVHADAVENGIPCIHYGELYTYYGISTESTKSFVRCELHDKLRYASKNDVIIVGAGENDIDIGIAVAYMGEREVAVHDACYILKHNEDPKYLSYCLRTSFYHEQIKKYVSSGKICAISSKGLSKAKLPVPPLEVQREIVHVLDSYTASNNELKEQLEKELAARQKQYEFYRNELLNTDENRIELKQVVNKASSGSTPNKKNIEYYEGGMIPWIRTQDVKFNEITAVDSFITEKAVQETSAKWIPENCVIVAISGATAGRCAINKIKATTNQHCLNMIIDESKALYKYVFYCVANQYEELIARKQGARGDLNSSLILSLKIPVPPLSEQQRIVDILDRFDALCNDITSGLPAEIEARKKQYEYYRDKLLTFKELKKEA